MKKTARQIHLLRKFGITEDQYEALLLGQNGSCAVCGRIAGHFSTRLAVDHDHITGEIRGLLCNYCNRRIVGRYRKHTAQLVYLRQAVDYLDREYTGWIVPPKAKKRKRNGKKLRVKDKRNDRRVKS